MNSTSNPYRLDDAVTPHAYRIFLEPHLDDATFNGRVEIDVDVVRATSEITLHSLGLTLTPATLRCGENSFVSQQSRASEEYQTVTFDFETSLPLGAATLEIAFTGILNKDLHGFYLSHFKDDEGVEHRIATTQFEQSDARRAFPCWDEPVFKATYQVNLTVPTHLAAYSNSPVASETDLGNGWRTVAFTPTMKMSTYLVAFVIGAFEATAPVDVDGVPLRVIYPKGRGAHLTTLALEAGAFGLRYFSDYFGIPYPGDKVDMVSIPDFASGAMENLGLITYSESSLLVDPEKASWAELERVAEVVHHELAHMWFGDLVTMEWWEGIWLNEAFATFMQLKCGNAFRPEWHIWENFVLGREEAMKIDGRHSTRAIEYAVFSPTDTQGMFDLLTYEKGAAVLRMLEVFVGEDIFRRGISQYLTRHSYANTITTDLWDAIEEASGEPVRDMMNTWILQGGHPLVTFENGTISQEPFAYGPARGESSIGAAWLVPVRTRNIHDTVSQVQLLSTTPLPVAAASPVVVNAGGTGVFRTRYGATELAALAPHIAGLLEIERSILLADTWAALNASRITYNEFLTVARGLSPDAVEPGVWAIVSEALSMVRRALPDDHRHLIARDTQELFGPLVARYGWDASDGESPLVGPLRATALLALGLSGDDAAIRAEACRRFDRGELGGDIGRVVLRLTVAENRPGDYDTIYRLYQDATTPQEIDRYQNALGNFPDVDLTLTTAGKWFDEFRAQSANTRLGVMMGMNEVAGPAVWRYVVSRWDEALEKFTVNYNYRLALGTPAFFQDPVFAAEVEAFHLSHPVPGEVKRVGQFLEQLMINVTFGEHIREQLIS